MITFLYILLALIVLMVLITVHEFGHYVAGKIFGFKINEFSIGFGPRIYQHKNKKTGELFSIRALPLGGYCAFEGEDEDNPTPNAFNNKAPWKRLIVLVSGVLFNFIFGVLTAAIFLMSNGYALPMIDSFSPNNANEGLLLKGDIVTHINGKSIEIYRTMNDLTQKIKEGENITVTVIREVDGESKVVEVKNVQKVRTEAYFYSTNIYNLEGKIFDKFGIAYSKEEIEEFVKSQAPVLIDENKYEDFTHYQTFYKKNADNSFSLYTDEEFRDVAGITLAKPSLSVGFVYLNTQAHYGFFESLLKAFPFCFYICGLILSALGGLFTGATHISELGGTVTAISQIAEISQVSFNSFLLLLPMLSMNLALFNILPIPALDGARCVFVLIEWIFRKPVPRKIENLIHTIGLFILLGFVIFLDVYHFFFLKI